MKIRTLPPLRGPPSSLLSVSAAALHFLSVSTLRAEKALPRDGKDSLFVKPTSINNLSQTGIYAIHEQIRGLVLML